MALTDIPLTIAEQLGVLGLWMKAVGIIVILWIVFQSVNFFLNRRRIKELYKIKEDMKRIEGKIDRILKKK